MGLLFPEDPHYNENERQTGFYRYRQLLSNRFGQWWKINLLTLVGFAPLAAGISYAVAVSSILVLFPCSIAGGAIGGRFWRGCMSLSCEACGTIQPPGWTAGNVPGGRTGREVCFWAR